MPNQVLDNYAVAAIRASMTSLRGSAAKSEAVRLCAKFGCSWQYIYDLTKDLRPTRKTRADKGARAFNLDDETSDVWQAAALVICDKLDPLLALQRTKLRAQYEGRTAHLPSLKTFRRLLQEHGLNRKNRLAARKVYRRWEAEAPGQIFQCDVTGLKERWLDVTTRKIVKIPETELNENHPNTNPNLQKVWIVMLVDDFSRLRFFRHVAAHKVTSDHIVVFLLEAFREMGVPLKLYTDNGSEFMGRVKSAVWMLNEILKDEGGFEHINHEPHNASATGKVEVAHQWAQKMSQLIGLAKTEGRNVTLDLLNNFAEQTCTDYNHNNTHRDTGEIPILRWHSKRIVVRRPPDTALDSAFLVRHFTPAVDEDVTVKILGEKYKLPGERPFVDWAVCRPKQRVDVFFAPEADFFILLEPGDQPLEKKTQWQISKVISTPDAAGEFKRHAETTAQRVTKRLKETRKADIANIKRARRETGEEIAPIQFIDTQAEKKNTVALFPHSTREITAEDVAKAAPGRVAPSLFTGSLVSFWQAYNKFLPEFSTKSECKAFLDSLFSSRDDGVTLPESEIRAALDNRPQERMFRVV